MTKTERERLRKIKGNIHHTESFGAVDGPGIRFVLFLQGCPLNCLFCHNPDAIPMEGGLEWTAGQTVDEIMRYKSFIHKGGVTFSGGEPLLQAEFVLAVIRLLKEKSMHTAIDTSGYPSLKNPDVKQAIDEADLLLLDIKAADENTSKKLTGHALAPSLATLDYCEATQKPVWLRHVLLQGYTLDTAKLEALAARISAYSCIQRVELLPFHKLGEPKWQELGSTYLLGDTPATTKAEVQMAAAIFRKAGLPVI